MDSNSDPTVQPPPDCVQCDGGRFSDELAAHGRQPLTADQEQLLTKAQEAFASYMTMDAQISAAYRSGSAATEQADALALGESVDRFYAIALAADRHPFRLLSTNCCGKCDQ